MLHIYPKGTGRIATAVFLLVGIGPAATLTHEPMRLQANRDSRPLIDSRRPAVFVSFLRSAEIEPLETGVGRAYLWFRITNNTRWPIWLNGSGVPKQYGDAQLYYSIEQREDSKVILDSRCHACSANQLGPGKSITFSLPKQYATADSRLSIEYTFEWERSGSNTAGSSSIHFVKFDFSLLPKSIL